MKDKNKIILETILSEDYDKMPFYARLPLKIGLKIRRTGKKASIALECRGLEGDDKKKCENKIKIRDAEHTIMTIKDQLQKCPRTPNEKLCRRYFGERLSNWEAKVEKLKRKF